MELESEEWGHIQEIGADSYQTYCHDSNCRRALWHGGGLTENDCTETWNFGVCEIGDQCYVKIERGTSGTRAATTPGTLAGTTNEPWSITTVEPTMPAGPAATNPSATGDAYEFH